MRARTLAVVVSAAVAAAVASTLALTVGSSGPPASPSARSVILKIPGCHHPVVPSGGPDVRAVAELRCDTPAAGVFAATFSSAGLERSWIAAQQAGTCGMIQGNGWAVLVLPSVSDACALAGRYARVLGGRVVSS